MKVWITKYALSTGIVEAEMEINKTSSDTEYAYGKIGNDTVHQGYFGNDFQRSISEAKADAERRRKEKIESLRNQIAKLEKLKF